MRNIFKRSETKTDSHEAQGEHREVLFDAEKEPAFKDALRHMPDFSSKLNAEKNAEHAEKNAELDNRLKTIKGYTDLLAKLDGHSGETSELQKKVGELGEKSDESRKLEAKLGELHQSLNDMMRNQGETGRSQETKNVQNEVRSSSPAEQKLLKDIGSLRDGYQAKLKEVELRYNSDEEWMNSIRAAKSGEEALKVGETNFQEQQEIQAIRQEHQREALPLLDRLLENEGGSSRAEKDLLASIKREKNEYQRKEKVFDTQHEQEESSVLNKVERGATDPFVANDQIKGIEKAYEQKSEKNLREHQDKLYDLLDDLYKQRKGNNRRPDVKSKDMGDRNYSREASEGEV